MIQALADAMKVAICRGTPKSKFESASHGTVGLILISSLTKCEKQEIEEENNSEKSEEKAAH